MHVHNNHPMLRTFVMQAHCLSFDPGCCFPGYEAIQYDVAVLPEILHLHSSSSQAECTR